MNLARTLKRQGWRPEDALVGALLLAAGVLAQRAAWADIVTIALLDEESSHIFLVLPVALWLAWLRRSRLRACRARGRWIGPAVVAAGFVLGAVGFQLSMQALWHAGAVVVAVGCLLSVLGRDVLVQFLPSFAVLAFLVPVPGMIRQAYSIPLQGAAARLTHFSVELFGVLAERSGNVVIINDMPVAVAEACNGVRMAFALVLVTYAFAFSVPLRNYIRVLILALSPAAAILCNVIRLVPTVLLYGKAPLAWADAFHDISGWLMLPIAFFGLMAVERALRWALVPTVRFSMASREPA